MGPQIEPLLKLGAELVFYIALLAFLVHLCILAFHWFSYGGSPRQNLMALLIYSAGSALLLLLLYMIATIL